MGEDVRDEERGEMSEGDERGREGRGEGERRGVRWGGEGEMRGGGDYLLVWVYNFLCPHLHCCHPES